MYPAKTPSMSLACRLTLLAFLLLPTASGVAAVPQLQLVTPFPGTAVVGKTPVISFTSSTPLLLDGLLILLDGADVSGLVTEENGLYSLRPPQPLDAGPHSLYIAAYAVDGSIAENEFVFSSRQSESFEEIYANNRVSATLKSALNRSFSVPESGGAAGSGVGSPDFAYTTFDSYLSSEAAVKEGRWETSLQANLRYYDQNAPLGSFGGTQTTASPLKKGGSILDFLIAADYTGEETAARLEVGDTTIEQSPNTIDYLSRRGGQASFSVGNVTLSGFGVLGQETGYEIDGLGLGFNATDHIMGSTLQADFFDQRLQVKAIYTRGGQEGDSFNTWSETGSFRKGDATGIVVTSDFFNQKLSTDFEFDSVNYDNDTGDESDDVSDKAYRIRISGLTEVYDYDLSYSYTGPQYDVVGNQSIVKDWAGFNLSGGMIYPEHSLRLRGNYSWDNVEDNPIFARLHSLTAGLDYQYSGWERFPVGLMLEHNSQRSRDEPEGALPTSLDTKTATATVGFLQGGWSIQLQTSYSEQDDRTENDYDTRLYTVSLLPSYANQYFSILPSWTLNVTKDLLNDVRTDSNTLTLDVYANLYRDKLTCELGGTYDWSEADDNSLELNNTSLYARLNYRLERLWYLEESTIALEYLYNRQEDKIFDTTSWEGILSLVLSTAIPYSL